MPRTPPSPRTASPRVRWLLLVGLVVVTAAITAAPGYQPKHWPSAAAPRNPPPGEHRALLGGADGVVPDGVTVLDDRVPAVANLDPGLLEALREAATDAADDGVEFHVNSGWRSPEYQD